MTGCPAQFGAIDCKRFAALGSGRDPEATAALGAAPSDSRIGSETVGFADFLVKTVIAVHRVAGFVKSGDGFAIFLLNCREIPKKLAAHPPKPNMEGGVSRPRGCSSSLGASRKGCCTIWACRCGTQIAGLKPTQGERK